jgi:hypothetical protein
MIRARRVFRTRTGALLAVLAAALSSCDNPAGTNAAGAAARVDVVSGDLQTTPVGTELAQPLVARVVDAKGKPVAGQVVNFRVLAGAGTVFAGAAVTNAQGEARERWTLGTVAGDTQRVEARAVDAATGQALVFAVFRAIGRADVPATITPVGEPARMGTAGFPLADSLAVRVLDRFGNTVPGALVAWTVRSGGGALSPPTSTTDAGGVARAQWTLGTWLDSTQVADAAAAVGITTSFVASAGVPAGVALAVRAGDGQTATVGTLLPQPVKVALVLPDGRPVAGAVVAWSVGATGGSVSTSTSVTDAQGEATAQWTLPGTAGTATLSAQTPGAHAVSFTATATPGAAAALTRISGDGQVPTPGTPLPADLVVRASDAYGNAVPGVAVAWTTPNGTFSPASSPTGADGIARARWTPAAPGPSTATATVAGVPPVTFTTQSQTAITLAVLQPTDATVTTDLLDVRVRVQSTYTLASVYASVAGRTVTLARSPDAFSDWVGQLSLAGLPAETYTLGVGALDVVGNTRNAEKTFVLDRAPTVAFRSPLRGSVQPVGPTRIIAVCRDDAAGGCASLRVETRNGTVLASGTDSVDFTYPWGSAGDTMQLTAYGSDRRGTTFNEGTYYLVESGPRLVPVASLGGRVLDYDGARVLYQVESGDLRIRTLAGGAEQTIPTPGVDLGQEEWKLTPGGALFTQGPVFPNGVRIYEWRDGVTTDLGPIAVYERNHAYYVTPIAVEGPWAAWSGTGGLVLRNVTTGAHTTLATPSGNLAPNGDVVFGRRPAGGPGEIVRFRNGALSPVATAGSVGGAWTDGVNVVAVLDSALVLVTPSGRDTLAQGTSALPLQGDVEVVDGWAAYHRPTGASTLRVWLHAPGGEEHLVSAFFVTARVRALGPAGQLVFQASGQLWLHRAGQEPLLIASDNGRPMWRGGELYILVGNTVFRVIR